MRNEYKRKAWLIDDDILLEGYVSKRKFYPDNKCCGFYSQKVRKKDIGKILFYDKEIVKQIGLRIVDKYQRGRRPPIILYDEYYKYLEVIHKNDSK